MRLSSLLQLADVLAHAAAQLGVEIRQRLVEQQHLRLEHERARHRDALLLAAGELGWHAPLEALEADQRQLLDRHRLRVAPSARRCTVGP